MVRSAREAEAETRSGGEESYGIARADELPNSTVWPSFCPWPGPDDDKGRLQRLEVR